MLTQMVNNGIIIITKVDCSANSIVCARRKLEENLK